MRSFITTFLSQRKVCSATVLHPDALSSYGYTGRLAYVNGTNQLTDASQAGNARFGIEPGTNTELIRLSGQNANQHYYVQVNAVPEAEFDDFALSEDGPQDRTSDATFKEVEHNHYRPERFVPFLTPQHNEELSEIQQQAYLIEKRKREEQGLSLEDLTKPSALYDWYYRPDYQFSVYDLAVNEINLIGNDPDTGEETETNIIDSSDPKITGASIVDILYDLTSSSQSPLERFDGEQTLVLSLGQQETNVTLTENNTLRFESLDYLNQLGSDDYLTIALYSNEDSANLLYEYMFGRNGLHVYYKIPHELHPLRGSDGAGDLDQVVLREGRPERGPLVRTLGGMRLKYQYKPPLNEPIGEAAPEPVPVESVTWRFNHRGRLCLQDSTSSNTCSILEANTDYLQNEPNPNRDVTLLQDWSIWWEPIDAAGNAVWNTNINIIGRFDADLEDMENSIQEFKITSRLLRSGQAGDDIAMLEQLLWQLGVSPERDQPGYLGDRIAEAERHEFRAGTAAGSSTMEIMVRRLQARSLSSLEAEKLSSSFSRVEARSDALVGNGTLSDLQTLWAEYAEAYSAFSDDGRIGSLEAHRAELDTWLTDTVSIWQGGVTGHLNDVPASYTLDRHNNVLRSVGIALDSTDYTREKLLEAWAVAEAGYHWGRLTNQEYRLTEGAADEEGSIGFNQVKHRYRYSRTPCLVLENVGFNHYRPDENLKGFAVYTGASRRGNRNCGGAFFFSFHSTGRGMKRVITDDTLLGYRHNNGAITTVAHTDNSNQTCNGDTPPAACEGDYETLAKALAYYNGETIIKAWPGRSWPQVLKNYTMSTDPGAQNDDLGICATCYYSIRVRHHFNLPYRQYIWVGAREPAQIPDPNFAGEGEAPMINNPNAGQPAWCFAFGEEEWVSGVSFGDVAEAASPVDDENNAKEPNGQINCITGEAIN